MTTEFDAWVARRRAAERVRVQMLHLLVAGDDFDGVAALIRESGEELDSAIAEGLVARCRGCSGRGARERCETEGSTTMLMADPVIGYVTVACPDCDGIGLVRGRVGGPSL